ncbi:MAG: YtpR family tRNA-binding protein [Bacteriovorax sp.]
MDLIVAEIKTCTKHPDATKLNVCEVFDGKNTLQIVCGAANAKAGMRTILAPVGSTTPKGLLIKEATLRGVASSGMLCSAKDIDVSNEDGIIDLPHDIAVGTKLKDVPVDYLSSTPWHTFALVDSLWENIQTKKLLMVKKNEELPSTKDHRLLSQTFFENNQYLYRHFKV